MKLGEKLLLFLSRSPNAPDLPRGLDPWNATNALDLLHRELGDLETMVRGRTILDYGCGAGWQAVALAQAGAKYVFGLDTSIERIEAARVHARNLGISSAIAAFGDTVPPDAAGTFDLVISQNSFEHVDHPEGALQVMAALAAPKGLVFMTFGPPWFAPYGAHMFFFTVLPWVNLWFSESTVMKVRSRFRSDGAQRYEEVEGGLNRMTVRRFERIVQSSGLTEVWKRYRCAKSLDLLGRIPVLRELFINHISCLLAK